MEILAKLKIWFCEEEVLIYLSNKYFIELDEDRQYIYIYKKPKENRGDY